ncbi:MAG: Crp/Fnr family transcriptional regulator [Candidatus Nealsonbacteria bacterium]|nr:Crp/Fnr family transcriptional regulator [Candidatus Nealsonbacteria bacterium]
MSQNVVDILQDCKLFTAVKPRGFQRLAVIAQLRKFQKGQAIFREGDPCPGVYVLGSGLVRVFKTGPGGKEHVLHIVSPGQTFAEVAAIGNFPCPAGAEAIAPTTCTLLPMDGFRKALEEDHELCLGLMGGLTRWVRHLVGLIEDIVLRDAAGRFARYLLALEPDRQGTIELPGLKRHVASHLNLTGETLSRVLRRLVDAGLVEEVQNNRIRVSDPEKLDLVAKGLFPET